MIFFYYQNETVKKRINLNREEELTLIVEPPTNRRKFLTFSSLSSFFKFSRTLLHIPNPAKRGKHIF
ncbi:hypothetical protein LguiA_001492 [Lonicera macranthoides]